MKKLLLSGLAASIAIAAAHAQVNMAPGSTPVYTFEQKPLAGLPVLIDPQQAQIIVEEFKSHYVAIGSPRILIYVHADLANTNLAGQVQHLIARPLRIAGATLVDKGVTNQPSSALDVTALLKNKSDRDALAHFADVVIDAQISSRTVTVKDSSGQKTNTVPELQLTALRLEDAKIIGQASASDLISRAGGPDYVPHHFSVLDVAEPTALALMDATLRVQ